MTRAAPTHEPSRVAEGAPKRTENSGLIDLGSMLLEMEVEDVEDTDRTAPYLDAFVPEELLIASSANVEKAAVSLGARDRDDGVAAPATSAAASTASAPAEPARPSPPSPVAARRAPRFAMLGALGLLLLAGGVFVARDPRSLSTRLLSSSAHAATPVHTTTVAGASGRPTEPPFAAATPSASAARSPVDQGEVRATATATASPPALGARSAAAAISTTSLRGGETPANVEMTAADLPPSRDPADLAAALRSAAGGPSAPDVIQDGSTSPSSASGATTLRPAQGAVLGAIGTVLPAARKCVNDDAPMVHATVVFDGSGSATARVANAPSSVRAAVPCIEAALAKARIAPFALAPYSVSVTVRP